MSKKKIGKEKFLTNTIVVWAGALICCALWGSAFPCIKIGYSMMNIAANDSASQILYAGYRFTLAGLLAIIIGSFSQRKLLLPSQKAVPKILWLSLLQTVIQYLFFYIGLAHTTGVKASIIEGMNVFVALIVACAIFKQEKFTPSKIIGCVIGFAGVVLVNLNSGANGALIGLDMNFSVLGEGFIFLSTVSYAFSSVFLKKYSKTENPVMLSGYQFVLGGIIMIICGRVAGGHVTGFDAPAAGMLLWLAMVSAVAYSLWGILLKYNPVSRVAVFGFMNPVFGVLLSAWLLAEKDALGINCLVSLVLVCAGIYVVNRAEKPAIK